MQGKLIPCFAVAISISRRFCNVRFVLVQIVRKPNGKNANLVRDLVNVEFDEEPVRDVFCLGCLRAFASAHCANHTLHVHGADAEGGAAPNHAPVLVEIVEQDGWKLIAEDVIGQPVHLERLKVRDHGSLTP